MKKNRKVPDVKDILAGDQRAGARLIRRIEDRDPSARDALKALYPHAGRAFVIGITGSPGAGKSTLIDALITEFRRRNHTVAVIAVDPSSPVSGGAILGDRLRMQRHAADEGVFIRSMAARGRKGGLSMATRDTTVVLDAMGYGIILVETVGAGQSEFDISDLAHCVGIVIIPGAGDGVQAIKAGILETGDVFIVNKSDRPGTDACVQELAMMLNLRSARSDGWTPAVKTTQALNGAGIAELADTFLSFKAFLGQDDRLARRQRDLACAHFQTLIRDLALEKTMGVVKAAPDYARTLDEIRHNGMDPVSAAEHIMAAVSIRYQEEAF